MLNRFKKSKTKARTKAELDREYADHAIQIGHKVRVIAQLTKELEAHEEEIKQRTKLMIEINDMAMRLPPEPPTTPTAIKSEETEAA